MDKISMKQLYLTIITLMTLLTSCTFTSCTKAPPNLSPIGNSQFVADKVIVVLSDFQDGVRFAYEAQYLGKENSLLVVNILGVAFQAIHSAPYGARLTAINALQEMEDRISPTGELAKWKPYIDQARLVLDGI